LPTCFNKTWLAPKQAFRATAGFVALGLSSLEVLLWMGIFVIEYKRNRAFME
jgi:hypothetical protein